MITKEILSQFKSNLIEEEKSEATIQKYIHTIQQLICFLNGREINKELLVGFREAIQQQLKARTVNGKISAINYFLGFLGSSSLKLKLLRIQKKSFVEENRELTKAEYKRLLSSAKESNNSRLYHIMFTIGNTGIRISELKYITVESVQKGRAEIFMKGKERVILLQKELQKKLLVYIKRNQIKEGCIFCTKTGKAIDRSNVAHEMKKLCKKAEVEENKVFPHNFRHLFARSYYAIEKNLAHLADILGHSSIETTRIYVAVSAKVHERVLCQMGLLS